MIGSHIRAVFVDAVGTVLFPEPSVSGTYAHFANLHGANLTEQTVRERLMPAYIKQEKIDGKNSWTTNEARERERWHQIITEVLPEADRDACFQALWNHYSTPAAWRVGVDVGPVLRSLAQRGLVLGMASNFDARLANLTAHYPELAPVVPRLIVSSVVGHRKPGRAFFDHVIQQAGCQPHEILYIGDDIRNDYEGAQSAGLEPLLLTPKPSPGINSIAQLSDLLG